MQHDELEIELPMRLFTAINFHDDTKARLLAMIGELCDKSVRGRFSLPENLHLTLVFLGECSVRQADTVKSIMDMVCFEPILITIDQIGLFKRDGKDIWWAGVRENKALTALQRELTTRFTAAGFTPDTRKYSPHITLGREVVTNSMPKPIEPFGETVTAVDLMLSEQIKGKLTYTVIYTKTAEGINTQSLGGLK